MAVCPPISLFRISLIFAGLLASVSVYAKIDEPLKVPKQDCKVFFKQVKKHTKKDLALVPYVQSALERIYRGLNVEGLSDQKLIDNFVDYDSRSGGYKLAVMAQVLEAVDPKNFEKIREMGDEVENLIGGYIFQTEKVDFLAKPEYLKLVTKEVAAHFKGMAAGNAQSLLIALRKKGWIGSDEPYRKVFQLLNSENSIAKDSYLKKKVLKWMASKLESIHKKIQYGLDNPDEMKRLRAGEEPKGLHAEEIEDGLHKSRRLIRKIVLMITSFDGMFFLDDGLKVKGIEIADTKINKRFRVDAADDLEDLEEKVGVSSDGYKYLVQLVNDLGGLKGKDGLKEFIIQDIKDAGLEGKAERLLAALSPKGESRESFRETRRQGKKIFEAISQTEILLQLANQFRAAAKQAD